MSHSAVFCDICNIGVFSEQTMREHVKGRRHLQALGLIERRKVQARNSVFCLGFPPTVSHPVLRGYFQQFGTVLRINIETQKGCYCIVQYDNEASVQKVLSQRNHQLCGYILTVRPRKPIANYHHRLAETERNLQKVKATQDEEEVEASHEQLMKSMLEADNVLSQMELLYESMRLSDADIDRRRRVCDYLYSVLVPYLPTCTIHQFGSSENGLGMMGCDMDIFLDLRDTEVSLQWEETLRHKLKPVNLPYIREIQCLKTTEGPLLPSQLRQLSLVHRVKLLSRILMQHAHQCTDVLFVPSVRCPIVRFLHSPTGIKCDVSINNRLALRNTKLLKMCAEDPRVRLLVFAVRYWGKWKQVAGNQNCGPRLSNYCLSLLVLFYLANTSPPVVSSVQSLISLAGAGQRCIIENWDCSLPDSVPPSSNTQTADELLHGFFKFYSQLSLSSTVILTQPGITMPFNNFLMQKIDNPFLNDFKVKAMAVQDPFVLCHNIAQNINNAVRDQLEQEFKIAVSKTSAWQVKRSDTSKQPDSCLWGLPHLFSSQGSLPVVENAADPIASSSLSSSWCEVSTNVKKPQKPSDWTCQLLLDLSILSQDTLTALQGRGDYRVAWFERVRTLLLWALRDVFLFTVKTDKDGDVLVDEESFTEYAQDAVEEMFVDYSSNIQNTAAADYNSLNEKTNSNFKHEEDISYAENSKTDNRVPKKNCMGKSQATGIKRKCSNPATVKNCLFGARVYQVDAFDLQRGDHSSHHHSSSAVTQSSLLLASHATLPDSDAMRKLPQLSGLFSVQQQVAVASSSSFSSSLPCSPLSSSHNNLISPFSQECGLYSMCPGINRAENYEVAMNLDQSASPASPAASDLPTVGSDKRDLSRSCPKGEASSGTSSAASSVECSPIGDGKVIFGNKASQFRSENSILTPGPSLEQGEPSTKPRKHSVKSRAGPLWLETSKNKTVTTVSNSAAFKCDQQEGNPKCRPLHVYCEGKCKGWYGRKVIRANLLAEGHEDDLELEKLTSEQIAARDAGSKLPILSFHCTLIPVASTARTEAEIRFEPTEPVPKDFSVFSTFFKSFFTKLVSKNLLQSTTV